MTSHPIITISVSVLWSPVRKSLSCSELPSPWPANQLALQCALLLDALSGRWACHQVGTHTSLAQAVELPVLWGTGVPSGTTVLLDLEEPFSFPFFPIFFFHYSALFPNTAFSLFCFDFFSVYRISGFAFYCCDKGKKKQTMWEGKDLFQLRAHHRGNVRGVQGGDWRQELKQGPGRNRSHWFAAHGLLSLLSYTLRTTCPGVALPTVGWTLPHPLWTEKRPPRLTYRPTW